MYGARRLARPVAAPARAASASPATARRSDRPAARMAGSVSAETVMIRVSGDPVDGAVAALVEQLAHLAAVGGDQVQATAAPEGDVRPVRRPDGRGVVGAQVRQTPRIVALEIEGPDVPGLAMS